MVACVSKLHNGEASPEETLAAIAGWNAEQTQAIAIADDIRKRDETRLQLQAVEGIAAGRDLIYSRPMQPEPLVKPKKDAAE